MLDYNNTTMAPNGDQGYVYLGACPILKGTRSFDYVMSSGGDASVTKFVSGQKTGGYINLGDSANEVTNLSDESPTGNYL
jgi:hypothetical protein